MDSDTTALLDHDDERLLAVDTTTGAGTLTVLDRRTGEAHPAGQVDYQRRAALVPGGVIASADGSLVLTGSDGVEVWAKYQGIGTEPVHTLVGSTRRRAWSRWPSPHQPSGTR